jgi:hypothetical protein
VNLPTQDWYVIAFYALFWPLRINGCVRRGRQPLLRGRDWFFDVRVRDGFYEGPGRRILRHYWLRMLIPFAVDVPWAIWAFGTGNLFQLNYLVLVAAALIHVNHLVSKGIAERQARVYAIPESTQPASRVALSLAPRRLRDYTDPKFEWALGVVSFVALAWLTRYYLASPFQPSARLVFGVPLFQLYVMVGMLIIKRAVIGWPSPVPQDHADEHMRAAEERRRFQVKLWDWGRASAVSALAIWPFAIALPRQTSDRLLNAWLAALIVLGVIATVIVETKRKRVANLMALATPVALPDLLAADAPAWPVCYEPSAPALMIRSARGFSFNLGSSLAKFSAAYVAGFVLLMIVLMRMAP